VTPLAVALASLLAMEPVVTVVHRRIMHGRRGWGWHRSHHRPAGGRLEANDLFPLVFAGATVAVMAIGAAVAPLGPLLWVGAGVTAKRRAYGVVHDLYVHERLGRLPGAGTRYVRWVAAAHAVHHRFGREPYGFLLPVVPAALAARSGAAADAVVLARSHRPTGAG
jgi:beta-carotene 3-hydroxylase